MKKNLFHVNLRALGLSQFASDSPKENFLVYALLGWYKKLLLLIITLNLFRLVLKGLLDRLNEQWSQIMRIIFILRLNSTHTGVEQIFYFTLNQQSS